MDVALHTLTKTEQMHLRTNKTKTILFKGVETQGLENVHVKHTKLNSQFLSSCDFFRRNLINKNSVSVKKADDIRARRVCT